MDFETKGSKILLVEDEESLAVGLEYNLKEEGYDIIRARDGREAVDQINSSNFDLIILDVMLPYLDGFEIAVIVRDKYPQTPILMLTARSKPEDKVKGLELGADDYLTKPFHLKELLLRVQGMLKRKNWYRDVTLKQPVFVFGTNEINFENFNCSNGKNNFRLTQHEAMIMKYFVENDGKIVSRKELLENVWHLNPDVESRTVDNFIARLRKYFEEEPANPVYIKSVRGAGYLFDSKAVK